MSESDRIVKSIEIDASVERVWRALTRHEEFGEWFRVRLNGPFVVGEATTGQMTYPGAEQYGWLSKTTRIDEDAHVFEFLWAHPADPARPSADDPFTSVEFRLEPTASGTRLTVVESGFDALPADQRSSTMRRNERGWGIQTSHIKAYAEA